MGRTVEGEDGKKRFEYFPDADRLRAVFWGEMGAAAPELASDRVLRTRVEKARLFGLLLWYVTLAASLVTHPGDSHTTGTA